MYQLKLFIAGLTPKSKIALANLQVFCEAHLKDRYELEIIDLSVNPALAEAHGILAVPTLIKTDPEPLKKLIGDLRDQTRLLVALNIAA